jgi:uncharacterized repeat protein (TIGR01451 family)
MRIQEIVDDLPTGLLFDYPESAALNPGWVTGTAISSGAIQLYYTTTPGILIASKGAIGSPTPTSATVKLYLKVANKGPVNIRNYAEISKEADIDGNEVDDIDSFPDDDLTNDELKDNVIDEHAGGIVGDEEYGEFGPAYDEDDHDIADIIVKKYDAALRKWVSNVSHYGSSLAAPIAEPQNGVPTPAVAVKRGDIVEYTIKVFNQCEWPMIVTGIVDDLPDGLEFIRELNPDWSEDGHLYYNESIPLARQGDPGDTDFVKIYLKVKQSVASNITLTNFAEITGETDEEGNPVIDVDSTPDNDLNNDGSEKDGDLKDNQINEHREGIDGDDEYGDYGPGKDEDDHDIAKIVVDGIKISVEVDKDTIKRTSAAYVSLPGKEGYNNIGQPNEHYRYDIDFRSTSNVDTEEFVVDDPLEAVSKLDQIRVLEIWTPVVWGDKDNKFNVWYKTNKTNNNTSYSSVRAADAPATNAFPNTGFRLWKQNLSTTASTHLTVSSLGLAPGEYITAIRFEYGRVYVGFTSKNYADQSLNGEHRDSNGNIDLDSDNAKEIEKLTSTQILHMNTDGSIVLHAPASGIKGDTVDWTPSKSTDYYAQGAADAKDLLPAAYLVKANRPMQDEDIVSSVSAHIALGSMRDKDQDAVVTKEIVTFEATPKDFDVDSQIEKDSFTSNARSAGVTLKGGKAYGKDGKLLNTVGNNPNERNNPLTGDPIALSVLLTCLVAAALCLTWVMIILFRTRRKQGNTKGGAK